MVAGASSVFRAGDAWVVVLMAVRAAAAPNRPAIFLSMITPRHVPLPTKPGNQPKPVMFCSTRHFILARNFFLISSFYHATQF